MVDGVYRNDDVVGDDGDARDGDDDGAIRRRDNDGFENVRDERWGDEL